jgi:CheY-like chemotaxis protein
MKTILYAEDREDDVFFFNRACKRAGIAGRVDVRTVPNGAVAIEYLRGGGEYGDRGRHPLPDLVVVDLKMPVKSGLEVLEWIREQPALRPLPVYLLTSSNQDSDLQRATQLGADGYLIKSGGLHELTQMVADLYAKCLADRADHLRVAVN